MSYCTKLILSLLIFLCVGNFSSNAQDIYVRERPHMPHYIRHAAPSQRHIWIEEDWELRGGAYVFVGGHWAEPPRLGTAWVPGYWETRQHGNIWIRGHWREDEHRVIEREHHDRGREHHEREREHHEREREHREREHRD